MVANLVLVSVKGYNIDSCNNDPAGFFGRFLFQAGWFYIILALYRFKPTRFLSVIVYC